MISLLQRAFLDYHGGQLAEAAVSTRLDDAGLGESSGICLQLHGLRQAYDTLL